MRGRKKTTNSFRIDSIEEEGKDPVFLVRGWTLEGKRVRERYREERAAIARRNELEGQWITQRESRGALRETWMGYAQIRDAEVALSILADKATLLEAAQFYLASAVRKGRSEKVPHFDEATKLYLEWLAGPEGHVRERTVQGVSNVLKNFQASVDNPRLTEIEPAWVKAGIERRWKGASSRDLVRRTISGMLSWAMREPRRWIDSNPAYGKIIKFRTPKKGEPAVFDVETCKRLLVAARDFQQGRFLRYIVLQLLCGMRREETLRLAPSQINLADSEIRLRPDQAKTSRGRTIKLSPIAKAWLEVCSDVPLVDPKKTRSPWRSMLAQAKLKVEAWPRDVLRHTAISHHFRRGGSYGLTAEWAGNSEQVIKSHYQGRVSSEDASHLASFLPKAKAQAVNGSPRREEAQEASS